MDWYLIRSKPRQESTALSNLQRWGVESFCPQYKKITRRRGKKDTVICPLFPGYLFSRFSLGKDYRKVAFSQGVANVVMFGSIPAKVEEEIIEAIRGRMQDGFITFSKPSYEPGQTVQIQEGPFKGLSGIFEREITGTQRVALLLKTLLYARVIIERESISPIEMK